MPISEDRRSAWWKEWFEKDYSWEGLADYWTFGYVGPDGTHNDGAERQNDRKRLLQDLWREIEPDLIDERDADGRVLRRWTRAHLPASFASGAPAKLAWSLDEWRAMEEELARFVARWRSAFDKVDLRGCVLRTLPASVFPEVRLDCRNCAFVDHVRPRLPTVACGVEAPDALFERELNLTDMRFEGELHFENAVFCSSAWFHGVRMTGRARFAQATFCTEASFRAFKAEVLYLGNTITGGNLYLDEAKVDDLVDLSSATIGGGLWAAGLTSRNFDLTAARLSGDVWAPAMRCERLWAGRLTADGRVNLAGTLGGGNLDLSGARIAGALDLSQADEAEPWFEKSSLEGLDCSGEADFRDRIFGVSTTFRSARFRGPVNFGGAVWPDGQPGRGVFRDCIFEKIVDFRGTTSVPFAAFDGISAKGEIRINRSEYLEYDSFRDQLRSHHGEDGLECLENGCRALKLSASAGQNRLTEQSFYRLELLARRVRPSTAPVERLASIIYQYTSDFGLSLTRPLAALAIIWLAFSMVYNATAWGRNTQHWASSLDFAGQQVFKPFSAWSDPSDCRRLGSLPVTSADTACKLLGGGEPAVELATRLLSSLQSIVSTSMLFLFALAIKRRFQIT
ncbi:pentapeptide repeat-containing protein [Sphingomonas sp. BK580]|uniref:pentapeptide repeat-containing protein n=1 Tax=Sphingomonas sp. BK580 TaxID=2586972 RepID=UPI0016086178|nr:pentapeptide repeat-containing protein [Sphingomonas sp. BK580]MBB3693616.1 hypothetical protein [Sphingomonas sp. BK580]